MYKEAAELSSCKKTAAFYKHQYFAKTAAASMNNLVQDTQYQLNKK
jgi:hypothetical protein